jgi:hypothetical protein
MGRKLKRTLKKVVKPFRKNKAKKKSGKAVVVLAMLGVLGLSLTASIKAGQPVSIVPGMPESRYAFTNAVLTISSHTLATIPAVPVGYRQIVIPNNLAGAAAFFYRVDGSTINIPTTGLNVAANERLEIETSGVIYLLRGAGVAAADVRYLEIRK